MTTTTSKTLVWAVASTTIEYLSSKGYITDEHRLPERADPGYRPYPIWRIIPPDLSARRIATIYFYDDKAMLVGRRNETFYYADPNFPENLEQQINHRLAGDDR